MLRSFAVAGSPPELILDDEVGYQVGIDKKLLRCSTNKPQ